MKLKTLSKVIIINIVVFLMILNVFFICVPLEFGDARGHDIERENYLKELRKLVVKGDKTRNETGIYFREIQKEETRRDGRERSTSPKPVLNFDRQIPRRGAYYDTDWRRSRNNTYYDGTTRDGDHWRRSHQYCDRYGQRSYYLSVDDTSWRRRGYDYHHGCVSRWQSPHQSRDYHYGSGTSYGHSHSQERSLYRNFFDTKPNEEGKISLSCMHSIILV